ncbi:MAG: PQQ-like beta-propeller repeat protein, partial [Planctomycetales bacterium]
TPADQGAELLKQALQELPGCKGSQHGDLLFLTRDGSLPGAADWSHQGADAANSGAAADAFLKAPLGLLWFDGSLRWHRKPGSVVVRVTGGRLLIKADKLYAQDVYTGRRLWEKELPASVAPGAATEFVAVEDAVYLTAGKQHCLALDLATGKEIAKIEIPREALAEAGAGWSNLRVWRNYLVAGVGKQLVCVDRRTGKFQWRQPMQRAQLDVAVGAGKVFCAESADKRRGETPSQNAGIRAFDVKTGKELWRIDGASDPRYSVAFDLLVTSRGVYRGKDGEKVRDLKSSAPIVGDSLIVGARESFAMYDLLSGSQSVEEMKWYRRGCTGLRASTHLVTTRYQGSAAYVDFSARKITPLWNVRSACNNNLFPANGVLNAPNLTGGCACNYTPSSLTFAPESSLARPGAEKSQ